MDALKTVVKVLFWLSLSGVVLCAAVSTYFSCKTARLLQGFSSRQETPRGKRLAEIIALADEMREPYRPFLVRYCEYVSAHGYGSDANAALAEIDALEGKEARREWFEKTYAQCVTDDNELYEVLSVVRTPNSEAAAQSVTFTGSNNTYNRTSGGGSIISNKSVSRVV